MLTVTLNEVGYRFELLYTDRFKLQGELKTSGDLFIHLDVTTWAPSVYKEILLAVKDIKTVLSQKGHKYLWCFIPIEKAKLASIFGFEFDSEYTDTQNRALLLMKQGT